MKKVFKHELALSDLEEQASYLNEEAPELGLRFLEQVAFAFDFLCKMPEVGRPFESIRSELLGIRVWPVGDYRKHLIFYRPTPEGIEILRVLHGSRNFEGLV
jgi:toxin ParE1/3/4